MGTYYPPKIIHDGNALLIYRHRCMFDRIVGRLLNKGFVKVGIGHYEKRIKPGTLLRIRTLTALDNERYFWIESERLQELTVDNKTLPA